jgi:hypothetical protein
MGAGLLAVAELLIQQPVEEPMRRGVVGHRLADQVVELQLELDPGFLEDFAELASERDAVMEDILVTAR